MSKTLQNKLHGAQRQNGGVTLQRLNAEGEEMKNYFKKDEEILMSVGAFIGGYISPTSWQVCNEACHSVTPLCGF